MTAQTSIVAHQQTKGQRLLADIREGSPLIWWSSLAMMACALACLTLSLVDERTIIGQNVWDKPGKFFFSLAVQFSTVAWGMSFLPEAQRQSRKISWPVAVMVLIGWLEVAYITFRAGRAEASHFNHSTPLAEMAYNFMGMGALIMTGVAFYAGVFIWRRRRDGLWTEAAALGLMLGAVLGTFAGMYMGNQYSHWVGGDATDATGTGFFGWSTTGGDLRIAHFVGLHAAQFIPFAALSGSRLFVWLVALICALVTGGTFAIAITGMPLFKV
jgi:hypothetical protein